MSDRVMLQGLWAQNKLKLQGMVVRAQALVRGIHTLANPFLPITDLHADEIASQARDLEKLSAEIKDLTEKIRELETELGIDGG